MSDEELEQLTDDDYEALVALEERALDVLEELDARAKCLAEIDRRSAAMVESQRDGPLRRF